MSEVVRADTLIRNAYLVTVDPQRRVITNGYIAFSQGRISAIGGMADCRIEADETIDASGRIVLPGMGNAHNHLNQIILRGYNDDRWPVTDIPRAVTALLSMLHAVTARLDEERSYKITKLHTLDLLKSGYTATHDEHFTNIQKRSVDGSWAALRDSGMRGFVARCILDNDNVPEAGRERVEDGLLEVERLRAAFSSDRIEVAPSFLNYQYLADPEDMRRIGEGARAMGARLDVDMTDNSRGANLRKRGFSGGQVEYYQRFDLLVEPILAGKGVHLRPDEYAMLAKHDARLAMVPVLRFFDGVGLPLHRARAVGMLPGLGTDAPLVSDSQNVFEAMRMTILAHNLAVKREGAAGEPAPSPDLYPTAEFAIEMATLGSARALFMDAVTGSLEVGKAADCVIVDTRQVGTQPGWNFRRTIGSLVWGGGSGLIDTVFVAGEKLLEGGRSTRFDEEEAVRDVEMILEEVTAETGIEPMLPARTPGATYRNWTYL